MTARRDVIATDGGAFEAYVAGAEGPSRPGVLVIQEIFGVNANIRSIVERFASQGFVAAAPDLFWRQEAGVELDPGSETDRVRALELMNNQDEGLATRDLLVAADHLRGLAGCTGAVGLVGYCMGGKLAYLAAAAAADAAVSYYGVGIQGALHLARDIRSPLLMHIAAEDHLCPPAAQQQILEAFKDSRAVTIVSYAGVGHAFARRGGPTYNADAADRADAVTLAFLKRHLRLS